MIAGNEILALWIIGLASAVGAIALVIIVVVVRRAEREFHDWHYENMRKAEDFLHNLGAKVPKTDNSDPEATNWAFQFHRPEDPGR